MSAGKDGLVEVDGDGEAMMCEGCGSTKTIAAILAHHGPQAIACCPERKMVAARYFWTRALDKPEARIAVTDERVERMANIISDHGGDMPINLARERARAVLAALASSVVGEGL